MFPNRHPSGILKSITLEARCKVTTESCIQPSNHMNSFITTGNPLNIKYWISIQQLCWCFLHFGRELSPLRCTLTEQATTLFQEKSQNGRLQLCYAKLTTCSQQEMEQHNRTTGWDIWLLLFSLYEITPQLSTCMTGAGKNTYSSRYQPKPTLLLSSLHAPKWELQSLWDGDWFSCMQGESLPYACLSFSPYTL